MTKTSSLSFNAYSATHIGLKRTENQDAFGEADTRYGYAFVVCDGMGGHAGGAEAAQIAVESITNYLQNELQDSPIQALHEAIGSANRRILEKAAAQPELKGMGSTCVILLITNDGLAYLAHVGDSRIYGWQDGELIHLTKDHSFVQLMVDQGQITAEEAENHPKGNQILRALGVEDEVRPTIASVPIPLQSGMRFLLCTDGLNGMINEAEITESMCEAEVNDTLADMLISKALNGGGKDNVTLTIVEIVEALHTGVVLNKFDVRKATNVVKTPPPPGPDDPTSIPPKNPKWQKYALLLVSVFVIVGLFKMQSGSSANDEETTKPQQDTLAAPAENPKDTAEEVGKNNQPVPDALDSVNSGEEESSRVDQRNGETKTEATQQSEPSRATTVPNGPDSSSETNEKEGGQVENFEGDEPDTVTDIDVLEPSDTTSSSGSK